MQRFFWTAVAFSAFACSPAHAQWEMQDPHVTADLRGIDYVGNGVAWASGSHGTVLRTEDMGFVWQLCATPPGAQDLDFRGVQAFDNETAIVMSSGPGDKSRLYKTTDGCQTWKLVFTNPDKDGFFDAFSFGTEKDGERRSGFLVGDPVDGRFAEFHTYDTGDRWVKYKPSDWVAALGPALEGEALFAASNSALRLLRGTPVIVTGGQTSRLREVELHTRNDPRISFRFVGGSLPMSTGKAAGAFSFAAKLHAAIAAGQEPGYVARGTYAGDVLVAVGGDYEKPDSTAGVCAGSEDGGLHWSKCLTQPNGYRSAVAYDTASKTWITVGPNGTDISTDDGRNWHPLRPSPGDAPDADKNWNALSLPFVVGPKGRIGILRDSALPKAAAKRIPDKREGR